LLFEGNTFALGKATLSNFESNYLFEGAQLVERLRGGDVEVSGAIQVLDAADARIVPLIATHGGCGGSVTRVSFDVLAQRLLRGLDGAPVDGVFLALHGAMICDDGADAEIELLKAVRERVGAVPIVITLDLHAHVTPAMLALCDAIVGYQHYPHDDAFETGIRGAQLLIRAVAGQVRLFTSMQKLALLVPPTTAGTRLRTPMREIYKMSRGIEALPGVLSVSYFPSTPWAERAQGGTAFVIVTDGSVDHPASLLTRLCEHLWRRRHAFAPTLHGVEEVLALTEGYLAEPIVVSEMSDAVGAGAAGDSAFVLARFLELGLTSSALIQIVDPEVSAMARQGGVGARVECRIGNKVETRYGPPVRIELEVLSLFDGNFTYSGGLMGGIDATVGPSAVVRCRNFTMLVTDRPAYEYADEQYAAAGLNVRNYRFVVVKNPMNFRQAYAWAPYLFALDTPGAGRADLRQLPWQSCQRPFYPLDDSDTPLYRVV
jgi:microcystin degradation protein MlrC